VRILRSPQHSADATAFVQRGLRGTIKSTAEAAAVAVVVVVVISEVWSEDVDEVV
jgi:hypothetical protein